MSESKDPPKDHNDILSDMAGLAGAAGIDTDVCEFCEQPLDDSKPWRRGLDGCGAHEDCIRRFL